MTIADDTVRQRLVRTALVDDHPAMRAGIRTVLDGAPGIAFAGEASSGRELWPMLEQTAPDVVLMDFHLPEENGLVLCHRIKRCAHAPRVVILSGYADGAMETCALLAQADAVLSKQASARILCETLREAIVQPPELPRLSEEAHARLLDTLDPEEVALAGLLLLRVPPREIARTIGLESGAFGGRVEALLHQVGAAYGLPQRMPSASRTS